MSIYINGIGNISPQNTFGKRGFEGPVIAAESGVYSIVEPDYKAYIDPKLLRRMAKIIKMGVAAAAEALRDAGIEKPDAITTATALGCTQDTDRFLTSMIEYKEQTLSPTSFIQSTHNTIGGQIALQLGIHDYNMCYTQRGASFESALLDAILLLQNDEATQVLAGGFDELIDRVRILQERMGKYRHSAAGEGVAFFVLSKNKSNSYARLLDVETLYNPENIKEVDQSVLQFLERNGLTTADINVVVSGRNGDETGDNWYNALSGFDHAQQVVFKPFCGEFQTANGFAMWLAAISLHNGAVPAEFMFGEQNPVEPKNVLIYNHYQQRNHSFVLLSKSW
jgi:3-oxoacyl-[acyl-carrier-protein] synthase II